VWPARAPRLVARHHPEVLAGRREDVDHDAPFRTGGRLVRGVPGNAPGLAGTKLALLVGDPEGDRALEDDAELFVLVTVLGGDGAGVELDDGQGNSLAVDAASGDALPDLLRRDRGEIVEGAQRRRPRRKM
jgi:hypothetical protein